MNPQSISLPTAEELKSHPLLGILDTHSLERLLQVAQVEHFSRNEAVFSAGERAEKIMVIMDGTIKMTSTAANRREVILDIMGPTDIIGDEALTEDRRSTSAVVMRDAILLLFPAAAIRSIWGRNPEFSLAWSRYSTAIRERFQERVTELAYGNIEDRLLRILIHLTHYHGAKTKKGNLMLRFPLTHQELANLIGATRETTTLAVGRLRSSGAIAFLERKIVLKDKARAESQQEEKVG